MRALEENQDHIQPFLQRAAYLISRQEQFLLTAEEAAELQAWIAAAPAHRRFYDTLTDSAYLPQRLQQFERFDTDTAWNAFRAVHFPAQPPVRRRYLYTWRWSAAAAVLLLAGAALYLGQRKAAVPPLVQHITTPVVPGHSQALLTLADGSVIALDSNGRQAIAQPGVTAQQQPGQLLYTTAGSHTAPAMNTLTTPRGGQFRVVLPDGTTVWLNAASSLTYPTAFTGSTRSVQVRGEAYFEVAAAAGQPFVVNIGPTTSITVLGTGFNVNAYTDEPYVSTTLVQGAVKLNDNGTSRVLQPGQQALFQGPVIHVADHADTSAILAWKRDMFYFRDADIPAVMRQLSRWYDVNVVYNGVIPTRRFQGEIQRNLPLAEVLDGLGATGIRFRLQDHTIVVAP